MDKYFKDEIPKEAEQSEIIEGFPCVENDYPFCCMGWKHKCSVDCPDYGRQQ